MLNKNLILAVSDSLLYQFVGDNLNLKSTFSDYANDPKLIEQHLINIDAYSKRKANSEDYDFI